MAEDEAGLQHLQWLRGRPRGCEDLGGHALRAGEAPQPLHPAQRTFLLGPLDDRYAGRVHTSQDDLEGLVVIDLPAQSRDVLRRAALQQEAALVVVHPEPRHVAGELVHVEADRVLAEATPVRETPGLDDDVAEVDPAERVHASPSLVRRKSIASRLNNSGVSHCTQWPTLATM